MKHKARVRATGRTSNPNSRSGSETSNVSVNWPTYFQELFKIFKAINMVLAFTSTRKHLAVTFDVVRQSVESLIHKPLQLDQVSELTALLPDMIKFAYIPHTDLRINGDLSSSVQEKPSPPFSITPTSSNAIISNTHEDEHVLILELVDNSKVKRSSSSGLTLPPSLSPPAAKKLINSRNERFCQAVDRLISSSGAAEDSVTILQAVAIAHHTPVRPPESSKPHASDSEKSATIPETGIRPTLKTVLTELEHQLWYKDQIITQRTFAARAGRMADLSSPLPDCITDALMRSRNIFKLYTHQVAAIDALEQNKHVIVSTSTASGKSLIYQIPMLLHLSEDPTATAVFVYPTKALAQDQKTAMEDLLHACSGMQHLKVATYDGDTPSEHREGIIQLLSFCNDPTLRQSCG